MAKAEIVKGLKELMEKHTENRAKWFSKFNTYSGFDAWFTNQVFKK